MLISKFEKMPEGEAKDLIAQLDPYLQERLIIDIQRPPQTLCRFDELPNMKISAIIPHEKITVHCVSEYDGIEIMPRDPVSKEILEKLTTLAQQENDEMQQRAICNIFTRFHEDIERRTGAPHP